MLTAAFAGFGPVEGFGSPILSVDQGGRLRALNEAVHHIDAASWRSIAAWHSSIRHAWSEALSRVTLGSDPVDPKIARGIAELEQVAASGFAAEAALKEALLFVPRQLWIGPLERGIAEMALGGLIVQDLLPPAIFDTAYDPFIEAIPLSQ
jgi:hypothetical protein